MFERFTDRGRRAVQLACEEARMMNHNVIGTEHLLLGLLGEGEALAYRAMNAAGITLATARAAVARRRPEGPEAVPGHIPFTPQARKVVRELALREALQLGNPFIGTEHILLAVVTYPDDLCAMVLEDLGATDVREQVMRLLRGPGSGARIGKPVVVRTGTFEVLAGKVRDKGGPYKGGTWLQETAGESVIACEECGRLPVDAEITEWMMLAHEAMDHVRSAGHRVVIDSWRGAVYGRDVLCSTGEDEDHG